MIEVTGVSQNARVLYALTSGPKRVFELVALTGMSSPAASRTCAVLMARGDVERLNFGEATGLYGLRADRNAPRPPRFRGEVAQRAENDYCEARRSGLTARAVAAGLRLSQTTAADFEKGFRLQTTTKFTRDNTCPKFAEHERHLEAVGRLGAYPVLPRLAELRARL